MNFVFFVILALFFIILQTIVLPSFPWFSSCFDIGVINIIFLSLAYTHYGVLAAVVFMGLIMDSISGCAFFYHSFSYVWIYLIIQTFKQFVFQQSVFFILVISLVSILIQQTLIGFSIFIIQGGVSRADVSLMFNQIVSAFFIIPPGLWLLHFSRGQWLNAGRVIKRNFIQRYRE